MMESGQHFVSLLDANDMKPLAAFWIYNQDHDEWLLLAGHVHGIGNDDAAFSSAVSEIISANRASLPGLDVSDVVLALDNAPILELLNSVVNTGDEILGINFSNETINGKVIDGVYLYRMNITEFAL